MLVRKISSTEAHANFFPPLCQGIFSSILLFFASFLMVTTNSYGQQRCGTDEYMAVRFKEDPQLERNFLERQKEFIDQVTKIIGCDGTNEVAVPLAFHFTNSFDCSDESCMLSAIHDNIAILNTTFGNVTTSPNAANCPAAYPAISSGTCISFYLAEPPTCADPTTTACNAAITIGEFNNGGYSNSNNGGAGACWDDYLNVFILSLIHI